MVGGATWTLGLWIHEWLGDLDPLRVMRFVIPSVMTLVLGVEIVLASFFWSILRLPHRHR